MSRLNSGSAAPGDTPPRAYIPPATARNRVLIAILAPLALALLVGVISGALFTPTAAGDQPNAAPIFAALGIAAWFIGLRLYGLRGLGLRGGRPLFAGIGFAVLAWVAVLIGRFLPTLPNVDFDSTGQAIIDMALQIEVMAIRSEGAGRAFAYLLLFEAFATQLWAFGLVFRALADWRGGLTAAIASGILFGATGFLLFRESFVAGLPGLFYFLLWGVLYGMIRLRTGSVLGPIIVQALQSFTAWFVFQPPDDLNLAGIQTVYLAISLLFVIIIWRLWPRRAEDYRV
jgi:membrane protease YdiL (CAAX protease family)